MSKDNLKFIDNSDAIKVMMFKAAQECMIKACLVVQGQGKALAPTGETSALRDTLDYDVSIQNGQIVGLVGSPLTYAVYVEFGTGEFAENGSGRKGGWGYKTPDGEWHFTRGAKPRQFLRPAFRENKDNIIKIVGDHMGATFDGK